jgi:radical SAM superfamily enzyme YgiQ (UPF0313 family)
MSYRMDRLELGRRRILLISPRGPLYRNRTGIWKKSLRYAPLTLTTLAALVPEELDAEVVVVDEGIYDIDWDAEADIVGISAITGTAPRSYELADHFRKRGVPVVLGGVHPTLVPAEAAEHADSVVVGYAEETWPQLLRDHFLGDGMENLYVQGHDLSLAGRPFPKREMLPGAKFATTHTIEATRGCIHGCEFCVVPSAWGKPLQKPVSEVISDIAQMEARRLIFLDLNLIADVEYAKELFEALIPLNIKWGGLATTTFAWDEELLDLAAKCGCRGILIGFESLSKESLAETRKVFNARRDYRDIVGRIHERGIAIMGCFVFGFDHDTTETFDATVDFVIEARIDLPRYAILTPFPGTPLFRRLKSAGRIISEDWTYYDGQHVNFMPERMTPNELLHGTERAWKRTYGYRSMVKRLLGARNQLSVAIPANLGYRFYANRLHEFYNCEMVLGDSVLAGSGAR